VRGPRTIALITCLGAAFAVSACGSGTSGTPAAPTLLGVLDVAVPGRWVTSQWAAQRFRLRNPQEDSGCCRLKRYACASLRLGRLPTSQ
jgi:hypothetical protein